MALKTGSEAKPDLPPVLGFDRFFFYILGNFFGLDWPLVSGSVFKTKEDYERVLCMPCSSVNLFMYFL